MDGWDYAILRGDFARKGLTARKEPGSQSFFGCKDGAMITKGHTQLELIPPRTSSYTSSLLPATLLCYTMLCYAILGLGNTHKNTQFGTDIPPSGHHPQQNLTPKKPSHPENFTPIKPHTQKTSHPKTPPHSPSPKKPHTQNPTTFTLTQKNNLTPQKPTTFTLNTFTLTQTPPSERSPQDPPSKAPTTTPVTTYQLPATSYHLPATSYQLPATSYQLPAPSFPLHYSPFLLQNLLLLKAVLASRLDGWMGDCVCVYAHRTKASSLFFSWCC